VERQAGVRPVQDDLADVTAGGAAVLVVHGVDLGVRVGRAARGRDRGDEVADGGGRVRHAVVGRSVVVLDLLHRQDAGRAEAGDDLAAAGGDA
jgi:hypothetical protein